MSLPSNATPGAPLTVQLSGEGVALVTLSLPDRRNALTVELTAAWRTALAELGSNAHLRAVVVTGSGPAFCAGGDLTWISESPDLSVADIRERMLAFYRDWLAVRELAVPTLAAVNGPAVGAGLCLALACDLRYAAAGASFSAPFTRLGMHPGMAATWLLPEAVGVSRARELLFTGRRVDSAEALQLGLVHGVFPDADLLDAVLAVARGIAGGTAPLATRLTKAALSRGAPGSLDEALAFEALAQPVTLAGADLREGLAAQRERRPPNFTGR
jgi:enoyl-CoA hydratase/carnithine racemase